MSLSEAQVERYSRQIILPEIGVAGQQRLLRAHVAIDDGGGELAAVLAPYLAGAGVGRLTLHGPGAAAVARTVAGLAPDTVVTTPGASAADRNCAELVVATDLALADLDRVALLGLPVIAGGLTPSGGWLVAAAARPPCVACVARLAGVETQRPVPAAAAGVVGSLLAIAGIKLLLGLGDPGPPRWLLFDAAASTLEAQSLAPAAGCPVCAAA